MLVASAEGACPRAPVLALAGVGGDEWASVCGSLAAGVDGTGIVSLG